MKNEKLLTIDKSVWEDYCNNNIDTDNLKETLLKNFEYFKHGWELCEKFYKIND